MTVIIAVIIRQESLSCIRWDLLKIGGISLGAVGAGMVLISREEAGTDVRNLTLAHILLFLNCVFMALYIILQKRFIYNRPNDDPRRMRWNPNPISQTTWIYFFAALLKVVVVAIWGFVEPSVWHVSTASLYAIAYASIFTSAIAWCLITFANKYLDASVVSAFWPLQVFVAVTLDYFVFDYRLTPLQIAGGLVVILGLLVLLMGDYFSKRKLHWQRQTLRRMVAPS